MFTFAITVFFLLCTFRVAVAIIIRRANRREVVRRADRAFHLANEFITRRVEIGYYDTKGAKRMKKDFDARYIELISK